ncbi:hydrogenase expression/formation protein HypE [Microbulbifer sp. OS29]|uniref:Hydrogenase expression/formation protein HypE n=1 Tax=Microbulbifer okhotskensis TaxID=2926617 RepID=A0A9X2J6B7_9GAMM|nr:hydrogenase expression/formation protein HypE [Microbulbifer okhotskensis]MCO1336103.1 hydrogenase expression/formation protein HypE [Microbulbifer okhotskensis]
MDLHCPILPTDNDTVRLGHGSGGAMTQRLLTDYIQPLFNNTWISQAHDSATLPWNTDRLVFTTDSFVVTPLFFPGGNIGELAVYGTVNDLAMAGAEPKFLSCGLILEEGLPMVTLKRVLQSMAKAAQSTGVMLVTGDTKVVERGKGDGIYINTSGVGQQISQWPIEPGRICRGDVILLSGDIGRHGIAVMASREGLEFESNLTSDCAPLNRAVAELIQAGVEIHCLRDLTRGGLATALVELAESCGKTFSLDESRIPVSEAVEGACEILGLDPLYVANEGRFVAFVPESSSKLATSILRGTVAGSLCEIIGRVGDGDHPQVALKNSLGCDRLLQRLPGEQLPRIC